MVVPGCGCQPDTFWTLLHDRAHWEFELFLMLVFDIILGGITWPFLKKHFEHHLARDKREAEGLK